MYAGYWDKSSVATFNADLRDYEAASSVNDEVTPTLILKVWVTERTAMWSRRQSNFTSVSDFFIRFKATFLPPDYETRMKDEVCAR